MVCAAKVSKAAPMGTAFTYQGRLIDANSVADGLYDFQFKLYDDANTIIGNQLGSTIDINDLDVIDGYFTVGLDFNDANSFNGDARWLEIGVRPGELEDSNAYTPLMPRQEVTPTPYAIYAKYAEAAGGDNDWMVSGSDMYAIPSGTVSVGRAHDAVGPGLKVSRGLAPPLMGQTWMEIDDASIDTYWRSAGTHGTTLKLNSNSGGSVILAEGGGKVGIGTSSPQEKLDVNGPINTDSVYKIAGSTVLSTLGASNTFVGIEAGANNTTGYNNTFLGKYAGHSNTEGYYNTFSGNSAGYFNTKGYRNTFLGNYAGYRNTEGNFNTFLGNYAGHHNSTGNYNTFSGNSAGYSNTKGTGNVFIGYRAGYNETGDNKLYIANSSADPPLIYGDFSTGNVGIGTETPGEKLDIVGNMKVVDSSGNDAVVLKADGYGSAGQISMYDIDETETVRILAGEGTTNGAEIKLMKADGTTTIELDAEYGGNGRIITQELQITGGSDLSEQFEVSDEGGKVKPGMVVCIDADNPGKLVVSKETYDRTVAGIVSGAGGVKPGMLMGQKGTEADGEHPVALTGRVYCWADASNGPIEPGDLLTTSDMAGHAMKVTDYTKAQGAILGKAMTSLEKGKGLVLVLVSLQ